MAKRKMTAKTAAPVAERKAIRLRPIGRRVLVMFEQSDWIVGDGGFLLKTGIREAGYRMDGRVVAVGTKGIPDGVKVGSTVYADPRTGDVVNIENTRYHLLDVDSLLAVAEGV